MLILISPKTTGYVISLILATLMATFSTAHADTYTTLEWDDLIPDHVIAEIEKRGTIEIDHNGGSFEQQMSPLFNSVKNELGGKRVKLPGFMVPLDGDENKVTEFLLVPYFGACMHTPPPPMNQIVYVSYTKGVSPEMLYDPVWIKGPIRVGEIDSGLAVSGYSMNAVEVSIYTETE